MSEEVTEVVGQLIEQQKNPDEDSLSTKPEAGNVNKEADIVNNEQNEPEHLAKGKEEQPKQENMNEVNEANSGTVNGQEQSKQQAVNGQEESKQETANGLDETKPKEVNGKEEGKPEPMNGQELGGMAQEFNDEKGNSQENGIAKAEEESKKRKLEEDIQEKTNIEEKENEAKKLKNENEYKANNTPSSERKTAPEKCAECSYMCWSDMEMKIHCQTTHGSAPRRKRQCGNCSFACQNTWEMDYHTRSRGHKAKVMLICKKCDFLCETQEESWNHKKVHIPEDKLFECGDCYWVGDRLDNLRYHIYSQDHEMQEDYEKPVRDKAEAKGPKELKAYETKLAKDIKKAQKPQARATTFPKTKVRPDKS